MDLYQQLILDHAKSPHHAGLRDPFDAEAHHVNTTCGDEVTLRVHVDGAGESVVIRDVSYDALGCSISTASASVLADEVIGQPAAEAATVYAAMRAMLTSRGADPGDEEVIGDGVALAGVAKYPARVKCALLSWSALADALARAGVDITSGGLRPPESPRTLSATSGGLRPPESPRTLSATSGGLRPPESPRTLSATSGGLRPPESPRTLSATSGGLRPPESPPTLSATSGGLRPPESPPTLSATSGGLRPPESPRTPTAASPSDTTQHQETR